MSATDDGAAPPKAESKPTSRKLSGPRKWLFRLAAMILGPALVLGLLELSLRIGGYGYTTDFFVDGSKIEGADVWIDNPQFGRWVFPRGLVPFPQPVPFVLSKTKPNRTFRIFILGESAAQGFPDPSMSFARVLEALLRARYPETDFEVVNTAMVAINSHVALQIAKQCIDHKPDLLVVHLGNNEVVGPFGAAGVLGSFSPSLRLIRTNFALKTTKSGQLFDRLVAGWGRGENTPKKWDGMAMFVNSHVRADDDRLPRIYDHFRRNLEDICQIGTDGGIPVVLCTIPCNLKDSAPFGSQHAPSLAGRSKADWEKLFESGAHLESEKKFAEAIRSYEEAARIDGDYADLAYRLGRCHAALGDFAQARQQFLRARDLDTLRFRSDTKINATIHGVATDMPGVRFADAERAFAKASPNEIPGDELFLEHVHMTFTGNYVLARTVFEAIMNPPLASLRSASEGVTLSEQECADHLAQTEWNEFKFGSKTHELLIKGPPFTLQSDHVERSQRWTAKLDALQKRLNEDGIKKALAVYQKAVPAAPGDWMIRMNYGQLLTECNRYEEADQQFRDALALLRHSFTAQYKLGNVQLKLENPRVAEVHFRAALRIEPESLEANIGLAEALDGQKKTSEAQAVFEEQIRTHPDRALARAALGRFFFRNDRLDDAKARFREALQMDPNTPPLYVDLAVLAVKQNKLDEAIGYLETALKLQPEWQEVQQHLAELKAKRAQNQ
jgi:Tfp pilus assembly protein PilF